MSSDELPPHVRALIDTASTAPVHADRASIRARIAATVATAAAGTAAAAGGAGKLLMAGAIAVVAAIGGGYAVTHARHVAPGAPVPVVAAPPEPLPAPPAPPAHEDRVDRVVIAPAPPAPSMPSPGPAAPDETAVLAEAAQASARGEHARVLELVAEHARRFPHGALAEERDALELQALLALGRRQDAERAARHFAATYPHSVHQPLVDSVLAQETH